MPNFPVHDYGTGWIPQMAQTYMRETMRQQREDKREKERQVANQKSLQQKRDGIIVGFQLDKVMDTSPADFRQWLDTTDIFDKGRLYEGMGDQFSEYSTTAELNKKIAEYQEQRMRKIQLQLQDPKFPENQKLVLLERFNEANGLYQRHAKKKHEAMSTFYKEYLEKKAKKLEKDQLPGANELEAIRRRAEAKRALAKPPKQTFNEKTYQDWVKLPNNKGKNRWDYLQTKQALSDTQKQPAPVTWTTATKELRIRFSKMDKTGQWFITPEGQKNHRKAQKELARIQRENKRLPESERITPLEAVNMAEGYALGETADTALRAQAIAELKRNNKVVSPASIEQIVKQLKKRQQ